MMKTPMTTLIKEPPRVRVVVSDTKGDDEPRIFHASAYQDSTPEEIRRAVEAGARWFDVAFGESLRRARQQRVPAEQAEEKRAA